MKIEDHIQAGGKGILDAIISPKSEGFLLIEIVITIVVLSIAALGVLSVFTIGARKSADPLIVSQANTLAQEKMDETIALKKASGFAAVVSVANGPFNPAVAGFTWSRTVTCVTDSNLNTATGSPPCASGYAHVVVTVTNAMVGSVSLETVITNY